MEAITELLENFDLANIVPELDSLMGKVETAVRFAVMLGPIIMFVLGLMYLLIPPKEANHYFGFRTFFGMGSVEAWRFTQKIAGITWGAVGLILSIVMIVIGMSLRGMEPMEMVNLGTKCLLWQIGVVAFCCLALAVVPAIFFDRKGRPRRKQAA